MQRVANHHCDSFNAFQRDEWAIVKRNFLAGNGDDSASRNDKLRGVCWSKEFCPILPLLKLGDEPVCRIVKAEQVVWRGEGFGQLRGAGLPGASLLNIV